MNEPIKKISKENFFQAVDYAYTLNRKLNVNRWAQNILLPLASLLFAAHCLIFVLGLTYEVVTERNATLAIFDTLRFIPDYCHYLWAQFGRITDLPFLKVVMFFVLLYLVPFVACGIVRLFLPLFVKGQAPEIKGTAPKMAKQLYQYVEQGPFNKKDPDDTRALWCAISGISAIAIITAIIAHGLFTNMEISDSNYWWAILLAVIVLLEFVLVYILYWRMHFVLTLLIKGFYTAPKERKDFLAEAKRYWLSVDSEERLRVYVEEERKKSSYDGWKYKNLEKNEYYKEKFNEHYATYMGYPPQNQDDDIKRRILDVEDDLSGGFWGDY